MLVLICLLIIVGVLLFIITYFNRRKDEKTVDIVINEDPSCCGAHEVCERDSLLNSSVKPEYFDDEELDTLSGIAPEKYTDEQVTEISDVFYSLPESNIAGWLKSLQLRRIELPLSIREQALMIVGERRGA